MDLSPEPPDSPDRFTLCTQPDVVSWKWESPEVQLKTKKSNGTEVPKNKTPKTAHLKFQKNKGSPLMYRPKPEELRSQTLQQMEMMINAYSNHELTTSNGEANKTVKKLEKKSPEKSLSLTPTRKVGMKQKSFEELFDDSMDDQLFQASQQFVNDEPIVQAVPKPSPEKSTFVPKKPRQNCTFPDDSFDDLILSSIKVVEEQAEVKGAKPSSILTMSSSRSSNSFKSHSDPVPKTTPKANKFIKYNSFDSSATRGNNNGNFMVLEQHKKVPLVVPLNKPPPVKVRSKAEIARNRKEALQRKRERQKLAVKELMSR